MKKQKFIPCGIAFIGIRTTGQVYRGRMFKFIRATGLTSVVLFLLLIHKAGAASPLRIVGSSAVFPFAATVAEHYGYKTHEPIPLVEAIGSGAGVKLFCGSLEGPDGVMTSRPLTKREKEKCAQEGITFEEFKIGQDGLVLIMNKKESLFSLTLAQLRQALAEKIYKEETCIPNPFRRWKDIDGRLPPLPIRVLGPAPTSGSYDVLSEKILSPCGPYLRYDGAYIEAPANENLIVQKVLHVPHTVGIVTFSFYDQSRRRLQALPINGVSPSFSSIQQGFYPLSRPLYIYLKTNDMSIHPARVAYALEFTSRAAIGEEGYLNEKGLIPLSFKEQSVMYQRALNLQRRGGI